MVTEHGPVGRLSPTWQRATKATAWAALLALIPSVSAAQLSPLAQREINALLHAVGTSGCQFIRGGLPYSAARAQEHLSSKYEAMAARGMLASTEDFIDKAATSSSITGQAYAIQCGAADPQKSGDWMRAKLAAMRQKPPR